MDCTRFEASLPHFIDGTLDDQSVGRMEAHLRDCKACAALHTAHRIVSSGLSDVGPVPAPPGFDARLFEAVAREEMLEQLAISWKRQVYVMVAAIAAIAGVIPVLSWMIFWWNRIFDADMATRIGAALAEWMQPVILPSTDIAVSPFYILGMIVVAAVWTWYESESMSVPQYHGTVRAGRR